MNRMDALTGRHWLVARQKILWGDFSAHAPILVYQMGAVGSSTVYETLLHSRLPNPVFHVHYLTREGIRAAGRFHRTLADKTIPKELRLCETLRRKMAREPRLCWRVVTLARDPVARGVSAFFHNAHTHYPRVFDRQGNMVFALVMEALHDAFFGRGLENPAYCWFGQEFKTALGMDVLTRDFDPEKGYTVLEHGRFRVLILRLEDLERVFFQGMAQLLGINSFSTPWVGANLGREKPYYEVYSRVLREFRLPGAVLESIYAAPYVRHFYSKGEIAAFMDGWLDS